LPCKVGTNESKEIVEITPQQTELPIHIEFTQCEVWVRQQSPFRCTVEKLNCDWIAGSVANCKTLSGRGYNLERSARHDPVKKDTKKTVHIALRPRNYPQSATVLQNQIRQPLIHDFALRKRPIALPSRAKARFNPTPLRCPSSVN
jgi:hypothetical protein